MTQQGFYSAQGLEGKWKLICLMGLKQIGGWCRWPTVLNTARGILVVLCSAHIHNLKTLLNSSKFALLVCLCVNCDMYGILFTLECSIMGDVQMKLGN